MCELVTVTSDFRNDVDNTYLCKGEQLQVLERDSTHWWRVTRNRDNCKHDFYAPVRYLQLLSPAGTTESPTCEKARRSSKSPQQGHATPVSLKSSKSSSSSLDDFDHPHGRVVGRMLAYADWHCSTDDGATSSASRSYESLDTEPEVDYYSDDGQLDHCGAPEASRVSPSPTGRQASKKYDDSPIYANFPVITPTSPPRPSPEDVPERFLSDHWAEYVARVGRKYYYNFRTGECSWKPPRRRANAEQHQNSVVDTQKSKSIPLTAVSPGCQRRAPPPLPPAKKKLPPRQQNDTPSSPTSLSSVTPLSTRGQLARAVTLGGEEETQIQENGNSTFYCSRDVTRGANKFFSSTDDGARQYASYGERPRDLPLASLSLEEEGEDDVLCADDKAATKSDSKASNEKEENEASSTGTSRGISRYVPGLSLTPKLRRLKPTPPPTLSAAMESKLSRAFRTRSMVLPDDVPRGGLADGVDELLENFELVVRQGTLNKTELLKEGKKRKKSWSSAFLVLTNKNLFLYRDINTAQESPQGKNAELQISLAGAIVDWSPEKSRKRNVFQVSTISGQKVLLQDDNMQTSKEWFETISAAIRRLPNGLELTRDWQTPDASPPIEASAAKKHGKKASRSRSIRSAQASPPSATTTTPGGTREEASAILQERKNRIRDKLRQFFVRRPTLESLQEKGIFQDEPVFGCTLAHLCEKDGTKVPRFVRECIEEIERRDMRADGLYRASGNLSQVQKVRCHVNQDDYSVLAAEEDIHVLTGALKMFFRHMKEPLFPFKLFNKFLTAISTGSRNTKLSAFKELLGEMPKPNYETLKYLLRHLLKVTEHSSQNRMHVQNLAIVFGPSLLSSAEELRDLAVDMMHQNRIIEFLLLEYDNLFL